MDEIKREKAHFHRLLGGLLQELSAWEQTYWLEEDELKRQHVLKGDGELNSYGRAIYCLPDLKPYRKVLLELQHVQHQALQISPAKRVPHALVMPLVYEAVAHVRVHRNTHYSSKEVKRAAVITKIDNAIAETRTNYTKHAEQSIDDKTRSIEKEIEEHQRLREVIEAYPEDKFRLRISDTRYRLYLYYQDGSSTESETLLHGVILEGPRITVELPDKDKRRRQRSDKMSLKPLWNYLNIEAYPESQWQGAKASDA